MMVIHQNHRMIRLYRLSIPFNQLYLAVCLFFVLQMPAFADIQVTTDPMPMQVIAQTNHNSNASKVGEGFTGTLAQTYCMAAQCLPKGTQLTGMVVQTKSAHRFHRTGKLTFQIQHAIFADGSTVDFAVTTSANSDIVAENNKATKLHQAVLGEVPSVAASVGATHALNEFNDVWHLKPGLLTATTFGAGAAIGVVQELVHPTVMHRSFPARIGWGILESTGIPDVVRLFKRQPAVVIAQGDTLTVRLSPSNTKLLFNHAIAPQTVLQTAPPQTTPSTTSTATAITPAN